jgi:lipoprotein LprG
MQTELLDRQLGSTEVDGDSQPTKPKTSYQSPCYAKLGPMNAKRLAVVSILLLTIAGCSHRRTMATAPESPRQPAASPTAILAAAKQALDQTDAVHFDLVGSNFPPHHNVLRSATGDAAHPSNFRGSLTVVVNGLTLSVAAISVSGKFFAQLPGTASYSSVDPAVYGLSDPGHLMSKTVGISALLTGGVDITHVGQTREGREVLEKYSAVLPGVLVGQVLGIADPTATVSVTFAVDPTTNQLRRAELIGPFYLKSFSTKYTLLLTRYGEDITIEAPVR